MNTLILSYINILEIAKIAEKFISNLFQVNKSPHSYREYLSQYLFIDTYIDDL